VGWVARDNRDETVASSVTLIDAGDGRSVDALLNLGSTFTLG